MAIERTAGGTSLAEVIDRILDKGLVIDAWVSISVIGIELITIEARVIVASIETYVQYAEELKYIGPVAGGLIAERQHRTLGEGVSEIEGSLQNLPLVGETQGQSATTTKSRATRRKKKR